ARLGDDSEQPGQRALLVAAQLTGITTEQFFNQVPALNPRETAHVQVSVDFPSSPTDHAIIAVYTTLDDSSEVWDLIPMMEFLLENTTDPNRISFLYKFRVGVPSPCSRCTALIATVRWWCGDVCGGRGCCRSSRRSSPVGSASRCVLPGTIGHASWAHSGTMSG